jgi:hypothetical protein
MKRSNTCKNSNFISKLPQDYTARITNRYDTLLSYIHTHELLTFLVHPRVNTSSREYLTLYIIIHYLLSIKYSWFLYKRITIWSCHQWFKCYTCIAPKCNIPNLKSVICDSLHYAIPNNVNHGWVPPRDSLPRGNVKLQRHRRPGHPNLGGVVQWP